jgi:hypothetical protein
MSDKFPVKVPELLAVGGWISLAYTLSIAVGLSKPAAAGAAVFLFFMILILWSQQRIWSNEKFRFRLTDFKKGQVAYKSFENAQKSIYVTHFTSAIPEDVYVAKMLQMMNDNGVNVSRLLPVRNLSQEWLGRFRGHLRYHECIAGKDELPFDFLIVDSELVIFSLPSNQNDTEFSQALIINNKDIAGIFHGIFEKLGNGKTSNFAADD